MKKSAASKPKTKTLKRGTKSNHLCAYCKGRGHYRTSCPVLAAGLLKAAAKHSRVEDLEKVVHSGKPLRLNVPHRPQRTLKRARGKRGFVISKNKGSKRKTEGTKFRKQRNRDREKKRKPKSVKQQQPSYKLKEIKAALTFLKKTRWVRTQTHCGCGDRLVQVPWKLGAARGAGRAYLRCAGCRSWYDCLAFSALPVLKMPLPLVVKVMKRYFHGAYAESLESCASALGLSGSASSSCVSRLFGALRIAENRCMDHRQGSRTLAGTLSLQKGLHEMFAMSFYLQCLHIVIQVMINPGWKN